MVAILKTPRTYHKMMAGRTDVVGRIFLVADDEANCRFRTIGIRRISLLKEEEVAPPCFRLRRCPSADMWPLLGGHDTVAEVSPFGCRGARRRGLPGMRGGGGNGLLMSRAEADDNGAVPATPPLVLPLDNNPTSSSASATRSFIVSSL